METVVTLSNSERLKALAKQSTSAETKIFLLELADELEQKDARLAELEGLINNPEIDNFVEGVKLEAAHQIERWGLENEECKPPHHYILVSTKLLGKLSVDIWDRNSDKFKHHLIALAAEFHNVHRQIMKKGTEINRWFYGDDEGGSQEN